MDSKQAMGMHVDTEVAQSCESPSSFSPTKMPSYRSPGKATSPRIKKKKTSWPHYAQDFRIDRVRQRTTTKNNQGKHTCGECPYTTNRRTNLVRHYQSMHSRDKQLECCGSIFSSKSELRRHVRHQHHTGYSCSLCSRLFCRKALLKRHMSVHNGVKEFTCQICSYASSHKSNLKRHQQVHGKHKPDSTTRLQDYSVCPGVTVGCGSVSVPEVDKTMARLNALYYHSIVTDNKEEEELHNDTAISITNLNPKRMFANPYKCLMCSKRWQSQEALSRHERAFHPDLEIRALLSLPMKRVLQLMCLAGVRVSNRSDACVTVQSPDYLLAF